MSSEAKTTPAPAPKKKPAYLQVCYNFEMKMMAQFNGLFLFFQYLFGGSAGWDHKSIENYVNLKWK